MAVRLWWAGGGSGSQPHPQPWVSPTDPKSRSKVCRPFSSRKEEPLKSARKGMGASLSNTAKDRVRYPWWGPRHPWPSPENDPPAPTW